MRQPERKETLPDDPGFFCQLNVCPGRKSQAVPEGPAFIEMTGADENQMNLKYFLENFPFHLESIDPYIPEQLRTRTSAGGFLQLLPGIHETDGFFLARLKRNEE